MSQTSNGRPFDNSKYMLVENTQLHYREWIPDTVRYDKLFLLIHGFGGSTFCWRFTAPYLSELGYRVVAVDIPPFGYSEKNPKLNSSVTFRASLLAQFMQNYDKNASWIAVGHSMGGGIVQALALMYPQKLKGLCFIAGALFNSMNNHKTNSFFLLNVKPIVRTLANISEEIFINPKRIQKLLLSAYGRMPEEYEVMGYLLPLQLPYTIEAMFGSIAFSHELMSIDVKPLDIPVLVIWGNEDKWVPLSYSKAALDKMNVKDIVIIQGAGHCPMETHPDLCNSELYSFFEKIP